MIKKYIIITAAALLTLSLLSCSNSVSPVTQSKTSTPSVSDTSAVFSIDYSNIPLGGVSQENIIENYFPDSALDIKVQKEFLLAPGDTFKVSVQNSNPGYNWTVNYGTVNDSSGSEWINDEVGLIQSDSSVNSDKTINHEFYFRALKKGKGYLCFVESSKIDGLPVYNPHGFIVGYTIDPLDSVWVKIDTVEWYYTTSPYSIVSVRLKGTTNAYRLRGMEYGDGLASAIEIPVRNSLSFDVKYNVAFRHVEGVYIKTDTRLLLYGAAGFPKVIIIKNPRNSGP